MGLNTSPLVSHIAFLSFHLYNLQHDGRSFSCYICMCSLMEVSLSCYSEVVPLVSLDLILDPKPSDLVGMSICPMIRGVFHHPGKLSIPKSHRHRKDILNCTTSGPHLTQFIVNPTPARYNYYSAPWPPLHGSEPRAPVCELLHGQQHKGR